MIGRALNGRYELVGALGVGGMATVWHGIDRVLGRPVAVKVLNGALAEDPRFAERFSREAQHAAMLVHPRIAMVFDSGMDQGSAYIVMELIRGRSLGSVLAEGGPLPVERAVGVAAAVCEALDVAHAAGLVHRDIKPGNIMITDDGGVKVVDFGIARASAGAGQQLTQTATVLGTAAYLSPEQATAAEVDGRADLYALGCVLTEMLTGGPPFSAETPVAVAFKQVTEEPAPVSLLRPEVPPALDQVVRRLLAKRPGDRPANAAAARAELLAAIPVAGAVDRTAELLTTAVEAAPGLDADAARTTVLPAGSAPLGEPFAPTGTPAPPPYRPGGAPTSVMASLPEEPPPGPRRSRRTTALVIGAACVAGGGLIAAFAFAGSSGRASAQSAGGTLSGPVSATPAPGDSAVVAPPPTAAVPGRQGPAMAIAALRADVAQSPLPKDRQAGLIKTLDAASSALSAGQPQDAVVQLKGAQRQVRDLAKKHAVDGATAASWQRQLGSVIAALNNAGGDAGGGANAGDNAG